MVMVMADSWAVTEMEGDPAPREWGGVGAYKVTMRVAGSV
jgi:hypothetical protein